MYVYIYIYIYYEQSMNTVLSQVRPSGVTHLAICPPIYLSSYLAPRSEKLLSNIYLLRSGVHALQPADQDV